MGISEGIAVAVERAGAMRRIRYTALCQGLEVVMEGIGRQRRRLARVVAVLLEGLTGRRGERTWHIEVGRVVLLLRKNLCYAESLSFPNACINFAELATEYVLDVSDALRRTCEDISL